MFLNAILAAGGFAAHHGLTEDEDVIARYVEMGPMAWRFRKGMMWTPPCGVRRAV